jgi:hypothetical protein
MRLAARCAVLLALALGGLSLLAAGPPSTVSQAELLAAIHGVASLTSADAVLASRGAVGPSHVLCAATGAEATPGPPDPAVWWPQGGRPAGDATGFAVRSAAARAPPRDTAD